MIRTALLLSLVLAGCGDEAVTPAKKPAPVPVASASEPTTSCEDFELLGDTARDKRTNLVWDRFVELSFATGATAEAACAARGSRLPTRAELLALRAPTRGDACQLPACAFRGDRCATIQCGSAVPGADARWGVAFSGGALVMVPTGQPEAHVCVR